MREAAVTLLGRHAASNQALALRLFNTLAKARRVCCWPDADLPCLFGGAEHIVIGKAPHILRSAELVHKRQPPCLPTSLPAAIPRPLQASTDPGTSVRKSAIKILWESCIRAPGFPRATGKQLCNSRHAACRR